METNAFGNTDIQLPKKYQDYFHQYCLTRAEGSTNNPESSPFPRMVDMWFLAMCIAVKENLRPDFDPQGPMYKAIEGAVFGSDPWRSNAMTLLAIAHVGNVEISNSPNEMLKIANGYATAGLPRLISLLADRGGDAAIDHLSDALVEMIK